MVTGPWSYLPCTRTISEPGTARTSVSGTHLLLSWGWKLGAKNYKVQISQRPDFSTNLEEVTTDNTSYAPTLLHPFFRSGGSFWWRMAAMDKSLNVGDWTQGQRIDILKRLRVVVSGRPFRRRWSRLGVTVTDSTQKPIAGATVRVSGAGIRPKRARTNRTGRVTFRLRAPKRGRLLFRATKAGFGAGTLSIRVR
jgi:hypothetical protein